jgi:hypothetical protein
MPSGLMGDGICTRTPGPADLEADEPGEGTKSRKTE